MSFHGDQIQSTRLRFCDGKSIIFQITYQTVDFGGVANFSHAEFMNYVLLQIIAAQRYH